MECQKSMDKSGLVEPQPGDDLFREWGLPGIAGNEVQAMVLVTSVVHPLRLSERRLARLQLAVAEATRNAIEHGNHYRPDGVVTLRVRISAEAIGVGIRDQGTHLRIAEPPDLATKLAEQQTGRGWGLYLIKHLVDHWQFRNEADGHVIEFLINRATTEE